MFILIEERDFWRLMQNQSPMTNIVSIFSNFDDFAQNWHEDQRETELKMRWQLLTELQPDELLFVIPDWLAEEKLGYVAGSVPTEFIGQIDRRTEKAVLLSNATASGRLMKLVHRIRNLEDGLSRDSLDADRREWLETRLKETREEFMNRYQDGGFQDTWIPKSQIKLATRRSG